VPIQNITVGLYNFIDSVIKKCLLFVFNFHACWATNKIYLAYCWSENKERFY